MSPLIAENLDSNKNTADKQNIDIKRTNRALRVIRATNRALIRSNSEKELMDSICHLIVEIEGYRSAWVGFITENNAINIRSQSGFSSLQKLNAERVICPEYHLGCRLINKAVSTEKPYINSNILQNPQCKLCWDDAKTQGYKSTITLPLIGKDKLLGVLNIFTELNTPFDEHEISLLTEMADDLAFGIVSLRTKEERDKALRALETTHNELEQRVLERTNELQQANTKLKELDKLKSLFIASMSHELRTPLNSIIGFTGIMLSGLSGEINEKQQDQLSRAYDSAKHLLELISDVIDIAKLEGHRIEIFPQPNILNNIISDVLLNYENKLLEKGIDLKLDIPEKVFIYTDRKRIFQAINNLVSNAVKYTEKGSITIRVVEDKENIGFFITDTGIGIPEENKKTVFQAFERLDTHLKVKTGGAGIGLYLTKKLIEEILNGKINFDSELGRGSTFYFNVPRVLKPTSIEAYKHKEIQTIS